MLLAKLDYPNVYSSSIVELGVHKMISLSEYDPILIFHLDPGQNNRLSPVVIILNLASSLFFQYVPF